MPEQRGLSSQANKTIVYRDLGENKMKVLQPSKLPMVATPLGKLYQRSGPEEQLLEEWVRNHHLNRSRASLEGRRAVYDHSDIGM
ncbi:hypothetical protein RRG08_018379 [Elysia crispata]|uniref:Uncharacterized protein n=1 Tax=Elysia crispata TaxID=231223 RepID=A0AAE0YLP5_9GAST|nr:hypothetical protein RRG08_018379 [Elysia crispata]